MKHKVLQCNNNIFIKLSLYGPLLAAQASLTALRHENNHSHSTFKLTPPFVLFIRLVWTWRLPRTWRMRAATSARRASWRWAPRPSWWTWRARRRRTPPSTRRSTTHTTTRTTTTRRGCGTLNISTTAVNVNEHCRYSWVGRLNLPDL